MSKVKDWEKDLNNNGVPDILDNVVNNIKKGSFISKTFTRKNLYLSIVVGLIIAGYGLFAYMYMNLRNDNIQLKNQYDWFKSEQEVEINKARMQERIKVTKELTKKLAVLDKNLTNQRLKVDNLQNNILEKPYQRSNENEVNEMGINDISNSFNDLGFPPIK